MSMEPDSAPGKNGFISNLVEVHEVNNSHVILHVLVVGFHHKKGSLIEYSYPSLTPSSQTEVPEEWKHLTSLTIPDGAHHHESDTIYFHLPPRMNDPKHTIIYGVSCYRQIKSQNVKNPSAEITRSSVQKAVCVLSTLPLYGHIEVHVSEVAKHFMDKGDLNDFSQFPYLFRNLNANLSNRMIKSKELYLGLSLTQLVWIFKHKILVLFKLFLLERKVILYSSKVASLSSTILTVLSLYPLELEEGLQNSVSTNKHCIKGSNEISSCSADEAIVNKVKNVDNILNCSSEEFSSELNNCDKNSFLEDSKNILSSNRTSIIDLEPNFCDKDLSKQNEDIKDTFKLPPEINEDLNFEKLGFPLEIFSSGSLCHPYLSLHYLEILNNEDVSGYVIGASNILFKQKRHLSDVVVEVEDGIFEVHNPELKRILNLTTEDLRFADHIVKNITQNLLEGTERDMWIRKHFWYYLLMLLRTSLIDDTSVDVGYYNAAFVSEWKSTMNYKRWRSKKLSNIMNYSLGHPFAGQLSVSDMKLRISHSMQSSERGRKLNQTIAATSKAVASTGKAVGGALSQAKGAFSSWWSNLGVSPDEDVDARTVESDQNNDVEVEEYLAVVDP